MSSRFQKELVRVFGWIALVTASPTAGAAQPVTLDIQLDKPIAKVSPTLYGLMTEEINCSYDGGLYAELIRNRSLMDEDWLPAHWTLVQNRAAAASLTYERNVGPSPAITHSLQLGQIVR